MASSTLQVEELTDYDRGLLDAINTIHNLGDNFTTIGEIFARCEPSPAVARAYWHILKPCLSLQVSPIYEGYRFRQHRWRPEWRLGLYLATCYRQRDMINTMITRVHRATRYTYPEQNLDTLEALQAIEPID